MTDTERSSVIELMDLTKAFKDFWGRPKVKAVNNLNLEIRKGEVFGLLGPNGSGKSTTIKMILGLLFPTSGSVRVFGKSPRDVRVKRLIGYMPEESNLYRFLNGYETLDFYGRLFDYSSKEREYRVNSLLDLVGLSREKRRPLSEYSKGMSRRIGLAQALVNDPELAILDEPTTGLDPIGTKEVKDLVLDLKKRGKTVLMCSHLLADVEDICDRIGVLYGGRLIAEGKVEDLLSRLDITQISTKRLKPETLDKVINLIKKETPGDGPVVDHPSQRLEEFFLGVVEEARRDKLHTSGVLAGVSASEVQMSKEQREAEKKRKELLGQLARKKEVKRPEIPEEALSVPKKEDPKKKVINELTSPEKEAKAEKEKQTREQEALGAEKKNKQATTRKGLLDKLTGKDKTDDNNA